MTKRSFLLRQLSILLITIAVCTFQPSKADSANCLWVSSYHQGYEWNDGIGRGLDATLASRCKIEKFYMDTKRNTSQDFGRKMGAEAFALVQRNKPDLIIASDDNASRYFVKPYLKNSKIPVVFCGINWGIEEYGYPYDNATGMVEIAPVTAILEEIKRTINSPSRGLYLSVDVPTEHIDYFWYKKTFARNRVTVDSHFVKTLAEWKAGYLTGQRYDFIIIGNNGGIKNWNKKQAEDFAYKNAKKLTVTNYDWMMPYTMLAETKIPDEQGEWAGMVALEILDGMHPSDIPIVPNRRWSFFVNHKLLEKAGIQLKQDFLINAIRIQQ
ncbi:MAG: hypothetical protein HQL70_01425 [Magnetococcales bacterium]|nr:hypothetical protein [Magnetococcales bacterium]